MSVDGFTNFVNTMTVLAAVGGVGAAWLGLFTWKAQSKWNVDNQVAHRILVLLYRHKDALGSVRNPALRSSEVDSALNGKEVPEDRNLKNHLESSAVYQRRWDKVREIRADIYPNLLEGQALWGKEFLDLFRPIWKLEAELAGVVRNYIDASDPSAEEETRREYSRILKGKRDILFDTLSDDDEFRGDHEKQLFPIENFLREKLGRR